MSWTNPSPRAMQARRPASTGRRRAKRILLAVAGLVVAGVAAVLVLAARSEPDPTRLVGQPAPAFELPDLADAAADPAPARGKPPKPAPMVTPARFLGHAWVLHTFGTWCHPCNEEHGALVHYAAGHAIPVVGIATGDEPSRVRDWLAKHGNPYRAVVVDLADDVTLPYDVKGVPQYFVIDAAGIIRARFYGPLDEDELHERLAPWFESAT
jgi:cytochrome c biogenesis protein CcmG/thiol:disulfide interchange protein DsbE